MLTLIYGLQKDGADEPTFRAAADTQTQRTDLWTDTVGEERMGRIETVAWTHIHYRM